MSYIVFIHLEIISSKCLLPQTWFIRTKFHCKQYKSRSRILIFKAELHLLTNQTLCHLICVIEIWSFSNRFVWLSKTDGSDSCLNIVIGHWCILLPVSFFFFYLPFNTVTTLKLQIGTVSCVKRSVRMYINL